MILNNCNFSLGKCFRNLFPRAQRTLFRLAFAFTFISLTAQAGDPSKDFDLLLGRWKRINCTNSDGVNETLPNLSIGVTGPRSYFVNVYLLNSQGKKSKLYFSTYGPTSQKGEFKLIKDLSQNRKIHVQLIGTSEETAIQITFLEKNKLQFQLTTKQKTMTCEMLPI